VQNGFAIAQLNLVVVAFVELPYVSVNQIKGHAPIISNVHQSVFALHTIASAQGGYVIVFK